VSSAKRNKENTLFSSGMQFSILTLVFALGVQTMIVELSLPRLLAPAFGNTLFCWTAAISEVLAALAIGYQVGGILSSRKIGSTSQILWWLAALSSGWVILSGIWGDHIVSSIADFGMIVGPLFGTLFIAVLPAGIGAAVLPISVALISKNINSGKSAGRLYALSTVGSVIGVLITGYLLLPFMGVSGSFFTAAALVFATFLIGKRFIFGTIGISIILLSFVGITTQHAENVLLDKSNGYHRIKVVSNKKDPNIRLLYLDSSLEGAVKLGSKNPGLQYQRNGVRIAASIPNLKRCFFLGGGSFSMPQFIKYKFPEVMVDVAEIDADVVSAAKEFFELSSDLNVFVGDARRILSKSLKGYDLIMNDAFHGLRKIPFHLLTRQFNQLVAKKLSAKGVYAVNVMGHFQESRLVSSMTRTLKEDFKYVNYANVGKNDIQNLWILASDHPLLIGTPAIYNAEIGMIFTDNHAPVEFIVASDFTKEGAINNN
jgi:spermidine synthase